MRTIRFSLLCAAFAISANAATLIHSYTFTGTFNDSTGSLNGAPKNEANVAGNVLNLDGVNDYVEFSSGVIPTSGSFSVLFSAQLLVSLPQGYYMELISQTGSFYFGPAAGSGQIRLGDTWGSTGVAYPNDGAWHTFGIVSDVGGNSTSIYIDGIFQASRSGTTNPPDDIARFGRQYNGHAEYFNGQMDNIRIYSGALTAGEVSTLSGAESSVPEPWTMALTGAGLMAFGLRRRMRAKHHHAG